MGLSSIPEAINDIKAGKFIIIVDEEIRAYFRSGRRGRFGEIIWLAVDGSAKYGMVRLIKAS